MRMQVRKCEVHCVHCKSNTVAQQSNTGAAYRKGQSCLYFLVFQCVQQTAGHVLPAYGDQPACCFLPWCAGVENQTSGVEEDQQAGEEGQRCGGSKTG